MPEHSLGLVSVSFRQNSPKEILSAMKKTNLTCIEWGSDIHAPCHDLQRLNELTTLQEEYGIFCCSYGTYFRLGTDDARELTHYANAAKILGTTTLRIWCGDKRKDLYSDIEKNCLLQEAKKAAEIAEKEKTARQIIIHALNIVNSENTFSKTLSISKSLFRLLFQCIPLAEYHLSNFLQLRERHIRTASVGLDEMSRCQLFRIF